jgi:similar to stage IV sporulation protein
MFGDWAAFCGGYLEIIIRGSQLEKLINLATGSGLYLWEVKRLDGDTLSAKMRARGFFRIRGMARRAGCRVKIRHKHGWPFVLRRLAARKLFCLGGLLCGVFLVYLASLVLVVRIEGVPRREQARWLKILAEAGLRTGHPRRFLLAQKNRIEQEALLRLTEAVWLGINFKGVVAEVKVVPRKVAPPSTGPADLVAADDGLITKVIVIRGIPLVKEGDTVVDGQLLISGMIWYHDLSGGAAAREAVTADGVVEAKTWYDLEVIEPKVIYQAQYGRTQRVRYRLHWGRHYWSWGADGPKPGRDYFWRRLHKQLFRGRNLGDNVEIIKDIWAEVTWRKRVRSAVEIRRAALREAKRRLRRFNYPTPDHRLITWADDGHFVRLQATIEVVRDIAQALPR